MKLPVKPLICVEARSTKYGFVTVVSGDDSPLHLLSLTTDLWDPRNSYPHRDIL